MIGRVYTAREWDADTDTAYVVGLTVGALVFGDSPWWLSLIYGVFMLAFIAVARALRWKLMLWWRASRVEDAVKADTRQGSRR